MKSVNNVQIKNVLCKVQTNAKKVPVSAKVPSNAAIQKSSVTVFFPEAT